MATAVIVIGCYVLALAFGGGVADRAPRWCDRVSDFVFGKTPDDFVG